MHMAAIQQMQAAAPPSASDPAAPLSMQSGPYAGCQVLEGKPIAMPGSTQPQHAKPQDMHHDMPPHQAALNQGMPPSQQHPQQNPHHQQNPQQQQQQQPQHPPQDHSPQRMGTSHSPSRPMSHSPSKPIPQAIPTKPEQGFQHMPCPPKLANSGRPYAQIRVKAEPSVLVHSSQLQPQFLAPVADMAQPLVSLQPSKQAQQNSHPHNPHQGHQPMGTLHGPSSYSTMAGNSPHAGAPIQTAVVLSQRPQQNGISFVRSAPHQQQPQKSANQRPQSSHARSSPQQGPYPPRQMTHQPTMMSISPDGGSSRSPHQRSQSDGQIHYSAHPNSAHPAAFGGGSHQAFPQQNGQATGHLQPPQMQMGQQPLHGRPSDTHSSYHQDGPSQDGGGILGMPPIPNSAPDGSQHSDSPQRPVHSHFQGTPFTLMSPPFPRYNSGPPVMQQQGHGRLLGPVQSAPPELEAQGMEFRMGSAGPNKSRYRGVSYDKKKRKWRVQIKVSSFVNHNANME